MEKERKATILFEKKDWKPSEALEIKPKIRKIQLEEEPVNA